MRQAVAAVIRFRGVDIYHLRILQRVVTLRQFDVVGNSIIIGIGFPRIRAVQEFIEVRNSVIIGIAGCIGGIVRIHSRRDFDNIGNAVIIAVQKLITSHVGSCSNRTALSCKIGLRSIIGISGVNAGRTGFEISGRSQLRIGRNIAGSQCGTILSCTGIGNRRRSAGVASSEDRIIHIERSGDVQIGPVFGNAVLNRTAADGDVGIIAAIHKTVVVG